MDWYAFWKLLHIASAIVAVGTNLTYFVWLRAMRGRPQPAQSFALETISGLDRRLANPAYTILPTTGVIMVLISPLGFTTFWIAVAIGLYVLLGVFGGRCSFRRSGGWPRSSTPRVPTRPDMPTPFGA